MVGVLSERNMLLEQTRELTARQAVLEERARITGEAHDLLGHRLSLLSLYAGGFALSVAKDSPRLAEEANLIRATASTALEELRGVLHVMRLADQEEATDTQQSAERLGTHADIAELVAASQRAGLPVTLDWVGTDIADMDVRIRRAVHRVVREGLTNVHRHAPGASVHITIEHEAEKLRIDIFNSRPTSDEIVTAGTQLGIAGVSERIRLLGGTLTAQPLPNGGFRLMAYLPKCLSSPGTKVDASSLTLAGSGSGMPPAYPHIPRRRSKEVFSVRRALLIGSVSIGGIMAATCCGIMGTGLWMFGTITPDESFNTVQIGQTRDEVERQIGIGKNFYAEKQADSHEPARPANTDCIYRMSTNESLGYRFCFRGEALVEKQQFPLDN
jgi:hypothetical protein